MEFVDFKKPKKIVAEPVRDCYFVVNMPEHLKTATRYMCEHNYKYRVECVSYISDVEFHVIFKATATQAEKVKLDLHHDVYVFFERF